MVTTYPYRPRSRSIGAERRSQDVGLIVALVCAHFPGGRINRSDGLLVEAHRGLGDLGSRRGPAGASSGRTPHPFWNQRRTSRFGRTGPDRFVGSGRSLVSAGRACHTPPCDQPAKAGEGHWKGRSPCDFCQYVVTRGHHRCRHRHHSDARRRDRRTREGGRRVHACPARLAISRIVLPAPGATLKIIRVAGTGTAGQRVRCFAKPVDGKPVEGATPTPSAVPVVPGGAPGAAGVGAPGRPAEYWYVSDLVFADRTGAWEAAMVVDAGERRKLDVQAAVEERTPAGGPEGARLIGPSSGTEVTPPTRVALP